MIGFSMFQMQSDATISRGGKYRYDLLRTWNADHPAVVFIMLNPSKADASVNDATIRRCMSFARWWGYGGIIVVNLFAIRSTDPSNIYLSPRPIGKDNDDYIAKHSSGRDVICAWGNHGEYKNRGWKVFHRILRKQATSIKCLGMTKEGHPKHPLRLSKITKRIVMDDVG